VCLRRITGLRRGVSTSQGCAERTAEGGRRALTRAERWDTSLTHGRGQTADVSSASSVEPLAPGHHGNPRAGSQSLFNGLKGQASYRRVPAPVRPVRHRFT